MQRFICLSLFSISCAVVLFMLPSMGLYGVEAQNNRSDTQTVQQEAAKREIKQIQIRNRIREWQLQQAVQMYVKLKNQSKIYPYKNHFRTNFIQESSLKIARDVFLDQTADKERFDSLQ